MIYISLFLTFFKIGLYTIGGGYASLPLIEEFIVNGNQWIDMNEYLDMISISEITPGPLAINYATFVGIKIGGIIGAATATLGFVAPSMIIVLILAFLYRRYKKLRYVQGILEALKPGIIAIIACAGLSILAVAVFYDKSWNIIPQNIDFIAVLIFTVSLFIMQKFKANPIFVIIGAGIIGTLAYSLIGV